MVLKKSWFSSSLIYSLVRKSLLLQFHWDLSNPYIFQGHYIKIITRHLGWGVFLNFCQYHIIPSLIAEWFFTGFYCVTQPNISFVFFSSSLSSMVTRHSWKNIKVLLNKSTNFLLVFYKQFFPVYHFSPLLFQNLVKLLRSYAFQLPGALYASSTISFQKWLSSRSRRGFNYDVSFDIIQKKQEQDTDNQRSINCLFLSSFVKLTQL